MVSMVPTLLWGKEITSTSDADSESARQRVGRGWSPRAPQHLAWAWAHSVKHSVKICRGNGSRLLPRPGGRPREAALLVYPGTVQRSFSRLAVSWSCRVPAAGPVSRTHVSWTTASHSGPHLLSPPGVCASGLQALHPGTAPCGQLPHSLASSCPIHLGCQEGGLGWEMSAQSVCHHAN